MNKRSSEISPDECPCPACASQDSRLSVTGFLDVEEAASFLRLERATLYDLVYKRRIPFRKHGRRLAFSVAELTQWSDQRSIKAIL